MSSGSIDSETIRLALGTLRGYLKDLVDSAPSDDTSIMTRFAHFTTKLRLLINYCERDETLRWIVQELHARGDNPIAWFNERAAGENSPRPTTPASHALAHTYRTLLAIKKSRLDLRAFVSTIYSDRGAYQNAFRAFREDYVVKLRSQLDLLTSCIEGRLTGDTMDVDTLVAESYAAFDSSGSGESEEGAAGTGSTE